LTAEDIDNLRSKDIITQLIEELGQTLPAIIPPLIQERDTYLTYSLQYCCRTLAERHLITRTLSL
jgi:pheromone shutdown protein TraB